MCKNLKNNISTKNICARAKKKSDIRDCLKRYRKRKISFVLASKGILNCDKLSCAGDSTFLRSIIQRKKGYTRNTYWIFSLSFTRYLQYAEVLSCVFNDSILSFCVGRVNRKCLTKYFLRIIRDGDTIPTFPLEPNVFLSTNVTPSHKEK